MKLPSSINDWYRTKFEAFAKTLNGEASADIHDARKSAIARFVELGFPSTHQEDWKYTDVSPIAKINFKPILHYDSDGLTKKEVDKFSFRNLECHLLAFVNGHFSQEFSSIGPLPGGVHIGSLAAAVKQNDALVQQHLTRHAQFGNNSFTALSTAFLRDGAYIVIPGSIVLDRPIHLLFISTGVQDAFVSFPRSLIVAGRGSQVAVLENFVSMKDNVYFTSSVSEIVLGENAVVEYDKLQIESDRAFHVGGMFIQQERNSSFTSNTISLSGSLIRNDVNVVLDGEGAEATLNGLYLGTGSQLIDNHTTIDHAKPHCPSHELYKGILAEKSKGVFNGKIKVRKDAQKTDAKQTNKNLILSEDASIDTKPQLEIFANDVKCTHGATIGQLDEEQVFYLRSRGVEERSARDILTFAFASEIIERIRVEPLRGQLEQMIRERLSKARM